ncbi:MAG: hypothetical protein ABMB14_15475, partial [Myxococcota bacterium]
AAVEAFFRAQIQACNKWSRKVGNTAPGEKAFDGGPNDPTRTITVVEHAGQQAVIQDADGARLRLDLAAKTVAAADGGPLPTRYQFCPSEVFVGPGGD